MTSIKVNTDEILSGIQELNNELGGATPLDITMENTQVIATSITLEANVLYTLKASSGFIYGINTGILDDCYLINGSTQVWLDDYFGNPFYCDTSIKFQSATGGNIFVVYS